MSAVDENGPERGGDDIVAAEYVLGVLPADERQDAARRIDAEPAFARLVDRWEVDFAPLAAAYPEVEAPASVKAAIDRRLFSGGSHPRRSPPAASAGCWSSLAFWRGLAAAALAALALYVALPFINPPAEAPQPRLVASLAAEGSDVRYLAVYDARAKATSACPTSPASRAAGPRFRAVDDRRAAARRCRWASFRPAPASHLAVGDRHPGQDRIRRGARRSAWSRPAARPPASRRVRWWRPAI